MAACGGGGGSSSSSGTTAPTASPPHLEVNTGPAPWPAPPPGEGMARTAAAGLPGFKAEQLFYHVHAHLDVYVDGQAVLVPAGIGFGNDPRVRHFLYKGQNVVGAPLKPCSKPCVSPLHTHDESGILHVENDAERQITLGQFFTEWGVRFSADCVGGYCAPDKPYKVYVDGQLFTGDASTIVLSNRKEIALVIGTPPANIPSSPGF